MFDTGKTHSSKKAVSAKSDLTFRYAIIWQESPQKRRLCNSDHFPSDIPAFAGKSTLRICYKTFELFCPAESLKRTVWAGCGRGSVVGDDLYVKNC